MNEEKTDYQRGLEKGHIRGLKYGFMAITPLALVSIFNIATSNRIPSNTDVEPGYAIPSKLEVKVKDLDGNGQNEVLMNYDGNSYLLQLDQNGKPVIREYEIIPQKINSK